MFAVGGGGVVASGLEWLAFSLWLIVLAEKFIQQRLQGCKPVNSTILQSYCIS